MTGRLGRAWVGAWRSAWVGAWVGVWVVHDVVLLWNGVGIIAYVYEVKRLVPLLTRSMPKV